MASGERNASMMTNFVGSSACWVSANCAMPGSRRLLRVFSSVAALNASTDSGLTCTWTIWMTTSALARRLAGLGGPSPQFAVEVENRRRIVLHHVQLGDDLAHGLLFLHLLGDEPLQFGHGGEDLLAEGQLVERVDVAADFPFLGQCGFEYVEDRAELRPRLVEPRQRDGKIPGQHEVEQLHRVAVLLLTLRAQPSARAGQLVVFTPARHRQVGERRIELRANLRGDGFENGL